MRRKSRDAPEVPSPRVTAARHVRNLELCWWRRFWCDGLFFQSPVEAWINTATHPGVKRLEGEDVSPPPPQEAPGDTIDQPRWANMTVAHTGRFEARSPNRTQDQQRFFCHWHWLMVPSGFATEQRRANT